jgi:hypothetical protein
MWSVLYSIHLYARKAAIITAVFLASCVKSKTEDENITTRQDVARSCRNLAAYQLERTKFERFY